MSTGGEVANALVCKTSIHGFNSHPVLHKSTNEGLLTRALFHCGVAAHRKPRFEAELSGVFELLAATLYRLQ